MNNVAGYAAAGVQEAKGDAGGGGMFVIGSGNINEYLFVSRSTFLNNKCVVGDGGALWANYTNAFLLTSNFTSNTASKGSGGAVSFVGLTGTTPIK